MKNKYLDHFNKPIHDGDYIVSLRSYKSESYKTDKTQIYKVVFNDNEPIVSRIVPNLNGYEYPWGTLYDMIYGDMGCVIKYENK